MTPSIEQRVRVAIAHVEDPEIPGVALAELGVVRYVREDQGSVVIGLAPTYTGCPATDVIAALVRDAAHEAGVDAHIERVLSPAWSSDDITPQGRAQLEQQGIAPPQYQARSTDASLGPRDGVPCPHCGSAATLLRSEFGSTPCKALYQCSTCAEPFDYFKCL